MLMQNERESIAEYGKKLVTSGLTSGTGGNLSLYDRKSGHIAISPSGMDYFQILPDDVVVMDLLGNVIDGKRKPSVEFRLHSIFYSERDDVNAVVHTHATACSVMAALHWSLPASNYLIAFCGSTEIPCAEYATFATSQLAKAALAGVGAGRAAFLANHGFISVGADLSSAFMLAEICEHCAEIHLRAKSVGEPVIVPDDKLLEMIENPVKYGQ